MADHLVNITYELSLCGTDPAPLPRHPVRQAEVVSLSVKDASVHDLADAAPFQVQCLPLSCSRQPASAAHKAQSTFNSNKPALTAPWTGSIRVEQHTAGACHFSMIVLAPRPPQTPHKPPCIQSSAVPVAAGHVAPAQLLNIYPSEFVTAPCTLTLS